MKSVLSVFLSALVLKDINGAVMPTSIIYQNCSYNETSFSETYDTPRPLNKTRWSTFPLEFGWEKGQGFKSVNEWTVIPGVGNYTNVESGV